jgi:hypothetical protein
MSDVATGTYRQYPILVEHLPALVRKQRRLAARIAVDADDVKAEKATREEIDGWLVKAGLTKGELVTCAGYDVRHNERDGSSAINPDILTALLVAEDVDPDFVASVITASTETGAAATFATVTPTKGASVRASGARMAKAGVGR